MDALLEEIKILEDETKQLKEQIEKMKCCANCKQFMVKEGLDGFINYCSSLGNVNDNLSICDKWELAE